MEPKILEPEVMIKELESIPALLAEQVKIIEEKAKICFDNISRSSIQKIYLVGSGDSYHAALASELLCEKISNIDCEVVNSLRFLDYTVDYLHQNSLVVGISTSGRSIRVIDSLKFAKNKAVTLAMTGDPSSPLAQQANNVLDISIPFLGWSPGVRTYIASLLGLAFIADQLNQRLDSESLTTVSNLNWSIYSLQKAVANSLGDSRSLGKAFAAKIKDSPAVLFLGSGPSFGSAMFSAAKVCEACGVLSFAQDLEEFAHVENLCYPDDLPVCILAPQGKSHWRAVEIAKLAVQQGRRVMIVTEKEDKDFDSLIENVVPVNSGTDETLSPFTYCLFGTYLATYLAAELGRKLFRTDIKKTRPNVDSQIQVNS